MRIWEYNRNIFIAVLFKNEQWALRVKPFQEQIPHVTYDTDEDNLDVFVTEVFTINVKRKLQFSGMLMVKLSDFVA